MRRPIEKLAFLLAAEPGSALLGELATKYGETTERIADAMDVLKVMVGKATYLPYPGNDLEGKPITFDVLDRFFAHDAER